MELEQEVQRGKDAKRLLDDPLFADVFGKLRQKYVNDITSSGEADSKLRESAYLKLNMLKDVETELRAIEGNGVVAEQTIVRRRKRGEI